AENLLLTSSSSFVRGRLPTCVVLMLTLMVFTSLSLVVGPALPLAVGVAQCICAERRSDGVGLAEHWPVPVPRPELGVGRELRSGAWPMVGRKAQIRRTI